MILTKILQCFGQNDDNDDDYDGAVDYKCLHI